MNLLTSGRKVGFVHMNGNCITPVHLVKNIGINVKNVMKKD